MTGSAVTAAMEAAGEGVNGSTGGYSTTKFEAVPFDPARAGRDRDAE